MEENIRAALAGAECIYHRTQIEEAVDRLATVLTAELETCNPVVLCVMNGGMLFTSRLLLCMQFPLQIEYIHATRYRGKLRGSELEWIRRPSVPLAGRTVLILDDILDEGHTLAAIQQECRKKKPAAVLSAVMVEKLHDRKSTDVTADHVALTVDDRYVFGYGMDYKGYLRNIAGIYAVM